MRPQRPKPARSVSSSASPTVPPRVSLLTGGCAPFARESRSHAVDAAASPEGAQSLRAVKAVIENFAANVSILKRIRSVRSPSCLRVSPRGSGRLGAGSVLC